MNVFLAAAAVVVVDDDSLHLEMRVNRDSTLIFSRSCSLLICNSDSVLIERCILQLTDHRVEFSRWWTLEFKAVKFPTTTNTTVFDYYIDTETKKFELWNKKVPRFELDPDVPLQSALVPTPETVRIRYWMGKLDD